MKTTNWLIKEDTTGEQIEKNTDQFIDQDIAGIMVENNIYGGITDILNYDAKSGTPDWNGVTEIVKSSPERVIITTAYASTVEFPEDEYFLEDGSTIYGLAKIKNGKELKRLPLEDILKRNSEKLEKLGFQNINSFVGYDFKEAYIYTGNEIGKKVYDLIQESIKSKIFVQRGKVVNSFKAD